MVARVRREEEHEIALDVVEQLRAINSASLAILEDARNGGEPSLALKAIDRIHRQVELQAKLLGEIDQRPQVNLYLTPEWLELRTLIVGALEPHPQAQEAIIMALEEANDART
jgi:hypothetical protein